MGKTIRAAPAAAVDAPVAKEASVVSDAPVPVAEGSPSPTYIIGGVAVAVIAVIGVIGFALSGRSSRQDAKRE